MSVPLESNPTSLSIASQCLLTKNLFAVFRYFGFEFSSTEVLPKRSSPPDPLTKSLENFYEFHGISFADDAPPEIQLVRVLEPLDADRWCTLVFIAAKVIEQRGLGKVQKETFNALEWSLRQFVISFGEVGKQAIPPHLPPEWRYQENRERLEQDIELFWK